MTRIPSLFIALVCFPVADKTDKISILQHTLDQQRKVCIYVCVVQEIAECLQQSLESALPSIWKVGQQP